jgi:hypothetical protein
VVRVAKVATGGVAGASSGGGAGLVGRWVWTLVGENGLRLEGGEGEEGLTVMVVGGSSLCGDELRVIGK